MNLQPSVLQPEFILNALVDIGIIAINKDLIIGAFNHRAEVIFNIKAENALSRPVDRILPDISLHFKDCLKTAREITGFHCRVGPDLLPAIILPVIEEGRTAGALCIVNGNCPDEQLELRKQKQALGQINRQLDAVFDSSYDGLFITDGKGTILKCNKSSERLIGHKEKDIVGKNILDLVKLGYIDKSVTHEVLRKKTSITILQRLRNGKRIIVTGTPVFNETGKIEFVVTNERDITALNQMSKRLREYREQAQRQAKGSQKDYSIDPTMKDIIASDPKTRQLYQTAKIAANFDTTILIQGETGVGKGRLAKFIHENSSRKEGPFVQINCGAIPDSLIESELFGYSKGAFTGANASGKPGLFQMADKGTLVLDEVSEIPKSIQVKFLKAIEEMEILAVGDTSPTKIDVRIIASTNKDLKKMISEKEFREDLFFRLNIVPIQIPPLRDRPDDILPMITEFLKKFNLRYQCKKTISASAMDQLLAYSYPGNVRELLNIIERVMVLCPHEIISLQDIASCVTQIGIDGNFMGHSNSGLTLKQAVARYEEMVILKAIGKHGSKAAAARALGVDPSTIVRKSKKFELSQENAILHEKRH